jgi:hypothetical protein
MHMLLPRMLQVLHAMLTHSVESSGSNIAGVADPLVKCQVTSIRNQRFGLLVSLASSLNMQNTDGLLLQVLGTMMNQGCCMLSQLVIACH